MGGGHRLSPGTCSGKLHSYAAEGTYGPDNGERHVHQGAGYVPGRERPLRRRLGSCYVARTDGEDSRDGDGPEPPGKGIATSHRDTEREPSPRVACST